MEVKGRRAICILGMHRSGTSAIARALELAGVYLGRPDEMMPAAADNPKGFYEHSEIVVLQEQLLHVMGRSWDCSPAMPENWWTFPDVQPFKRQLRELVKASFGEKPLWGWKDPRTCLTLPLWQEVLEEDGYQISYVIIFRNPLAVARSLHRRNRFSLDKSQALTALHNLYALHHTRGKSRVALSYDTLLSDCRNEILRVVEHLGLQKPEEDSMGLIQEWVDPAMSNSSDGESDSHLNLSPVVQQLWTLLQNVGGIDSEESVEKVEDLLRAYEGYSRLIGTQCVENPANIAELFDYSSHGASREQSVSRHISSDGQVRDYEFEIPWKSCSLLRFDPGGVKGIIVIDSIELRSGPGNGQSKRILHRYKPDEVHLGEGLIKISNGRSLKLLASHDDPQILLPIAPEVPPSDLLNLKIRMGVRNSVAGEDISVTGRIIQQSRCSFEEVRQQLDRAWADAEQAHLSRKETELKLDEANKGLEAARADLEEARLYLQETDRDLLDTGQHIAAWRHEIERLMNELIGFKQEPELIGRDFEDVELSVYEILENVVASLKFDRFVVSISHSDYTFCLGGTEKFIREEQADLAKRKISYIQLSPYGAAQRSIWHRDWNPLLVMNVDSQPVGIHTASFVSNVLKLLCESGTARAAAFHIHHLLRWPAVALGLLRESTDASKTRFYLHDYYSICPQYNLLRNDETYCGGSDGADLGRDEACADCKYGAARQQHVAAFRGLLADEDIEIIAPSKVAASVWTAAFPQWSQRVRVVPHQIMEQEKSRYSNRLERLSKRRYRPRIAYVGYQAVNKGWPFWQTVFSDTKLQKKYEFYALGACYKPPKYLKHVPVSFVDDGPDAMIRALKDHQIDVAFLWSIWPETYSYTLFEALAANSLVVTNSFSGNIAATVRESPRGLVFETEDALLAFLYDTPTVKVAIAGNLVGNRYKRLIPNDVIAGETASLIGRERYLLETDGATVWRYAKEKRHEAILDKLATEKVRGETIGERTDRLDQLEQVLHYYQTHWTHRAVESARRRSASISEKFPGLAKPPRLVLRSLARLVS